MVEEGIQDDGNLGTTLAPIVKGGIKSKPYYTGPDWQPFHQFIHISLGSQLGLLKDRQSSHLECRCLNRVVVSADIIQSTKKGFILLSFDLKGKYINILNDFWFF